MSLFPHKRPGTATTPVSEPAKGVKTKIKKTPPSIIDIDVSIEDRGYDPYDVSPREKEKRGKNDKWSF